MDLKALQSSVTGKVLFIALVVLLLLVPLRMIENLVAARSHLYELARVDIARSSGQAQTVGGPILVVPFSYTKHVNGHAVTVSDELHALPADLAISGNVDVEERRRGIHEVHVYTARLHIEGRFAPIAPEVDFEDLELHFERAEIALPVADARYVRDAVVLTSGNGTTTFDASSARVPGFGPSLTAPYAALGLGPLTEPQAFSLDIALGGTSALYFLPLGNDTRVTLASNWPSPSFVGAYSTSDYTTDAAGFAAEWRVLDLGRGYGPGWTRGAEPPPAAVAASAFGVSLITPVGVHAAALRATKHGVLILALTFTAYFLFEVLAPLSLHALQYLLIGLANCVFYLLLLALAEHIGFGAAYVASATAATVLIAGYSAAVLRSLRRAAPIGALLTALYGYLYVTLKAEDYALVLGALGVFATLAALMYLTRHVDWFEVTLGKRAELEA